MKKVKTVIIKADIRHTVENDPFCGIKSQSQNLPWKNDFGRTKVRTNVSDNNIKGLDNLNLEF